MQSMTMHEKSKDEEDFKERSTKKVKGGEQLFSGNSSLPKNYADATDMLHERVEGGKSYKAMVVGLDDEKEVAADVDKDDHKDNNEADNIVQIIDEPRDEGNEMQFDDNMVNNNSVQLKLDRPNIPRPPNIIPSPYPDNPLIGYKEGDSNFENEEFMDANDQSSNVSSEFEMEVVQETPAFRQ
ncbi:hypothetical protein TSUD_156380 [Trifolium subterraneum]|uniref:Uncharacterized protein n=1 Tax=Trifolium subterraneum TaxID=3900 RepID=A0A2Z6LZ53_TRISU|nr:hypothetical protein TSUD_156380 [Trifolium subterraneum]